MFRPRIIPCLLLDNAQVVKTQNFENSNYIGDPMNAVRIFNDLQADELIVLDITATQKGKAPQYELLKKIGEEAYMPFAVGGGIDTVEGAKRILASGAEKISFNYAVLHNQKLVKECVDLFGSQSICASIDVRKTADSYEVFGNRGKKPTGKNPLEFAKEVEKLGVGELIITSIDKEGTMEGYDLELIEKISSSVKIPIIALGGAGSYEDLKKGISSGASAVAAGSLFVYSGKNKGILLNYPDDEERREIFNNE